VSTGSCRWSGPGYVDPVPDRVPDRGSQADVGEELVRLASADNFRDVTGVDTAYVAADGVPLRRGVLFRSNELQLSDADAASVAALGVTAVYDLRHDHEIKAHPDVPVPGASWHHLEVAGIPMDAVSGLETREAGTEVMHEVYRSFVEQPGARAAFSELLTRIAGTGGAHLFHCTAGKDRTGWAAALLLHVAGVDDETILADYLLTNEFSSATRDKYLGLVAEHLGADKVEVYERVMVADADYLRTAYDAAAAAYGGVDGYLHEGLGLSAETLQRLREKIRE
jgi:protein-tyrosine phosphatase